MERKEPREKKIGLFRNKRFLTIAISTFIILIMALSVLNLAIDAPTDEKYSYKSKTFTKVEGGWLTYFGDSAVMLAYGPKDLDNITMDIDISKLNNVQKIYMSTGPVKDGGMRRALFDFGRYVQLTPKIVMACNKDVQGCEKLPIKTCEDATGDVGIITFIESDNPSVKLEGNCLSIEGSGEEMVMYVDKLIWEIYL